MLRIDLDAAGIPYRDAAGLVFDFHALRCQCATLADEAGVSPRVVQKLMRHSTLELTGRYTRPRAVDIEGRGGPPEPRDPSRPAARRPPATGTHGKHIGNRFAHYLPTGGDGSGRMRSDAGGGTTTTGPDGCILAKPLERGRVLAPRAGTGGACRK